VTAAIQTYYEGNEAGQGSFGHAEGMPAYATLRMICNNQVDGYQCNETAQTLLADSMTFLAYERVFQSRCIESFPPRLALLDGVALFGVAVFGSIAFLELAPSFVLPFVLRSISSIGIILAGACVAIAGLAIYTTYHEIHERLPENRPAYCTQTVLENE